MRTCLPAAMLAALVLIAPSRGTAGEPVREIYEKMLQTEIETISRGRQMIDGAVSSHKDADPKAVESNRKNMNALLEQEAELEKLARSGDIDARYWEGMWHYHMGSEYETMFQRIPGQENIRAVMDREYGEAVTWWRPLAEAGSALAQWNLGQLYVQGRGVPKSPSNAIDWYYRAAAQFRKAGDREHALMVLDNMREIDEANPLTKEVYRSLYPGH